MAEEYDYLFKSIVVGDGGVGKTALTLRFSKGFFTEDYKMTIGVDFHVKTISIDTSEGSIKCKLQLWDTGGQERFSSIRPMYYRGSLGAVLVFDLTNYASFEHLPQWIEEIRANIKNEIPLLLVGNKSDLSDQREVSLEQINHFTRDFNLYYMETSAKTGDGVGDCFYILACLMIGSGVPEQLIANETVFSPGQITLEVASISPKKLTPQKPQEDYVAPPVSEPISVKQPEHIPIYEPEIDYAAPPVPEPISIKQLEKISIHKPEIDYAAPPVPEPPSDKPIKHALKYDHEPDIKIPEPTEIEFKTPEEILSEMSNEIQKPSSFDKSLEISASNKYKPKVVPFSNTMPTPAPRPEGFPPVEGSKIKEKEVEHEPPFRVSKLEEPTKPKPTSMMFDQTTENIPTYSQKSPIFPSSKPSQEISSQSLVDYMPQAILSKKDKKKLAKEQKKKEKKKKLQEEREKQENLIDMKKKEKEKKEVLPRVSESPSLFQTLTQRVEDVSDVKNASVLPFVATKKTEKEETSKLRIIPNVSDNESESIGFIPITPDSDEQQKETSKSQELLICKQCGAVLSADYAYCNKCGNKL